MRVWVLILIGFFTIGELKTLANLPNGKSVRETLGVTNAGGHYMFDPKVSCMEDGANKILEMGSQVIKMWLTDLTMRENPYNTDWGRFKINNCVDLLKTDYLRATLSKKFSTVIFVAHPFDKRQKETNVSWWNGMSRQEMERTEREMYEIVLCLLTEYNGSGKEFILQNWEGDNMLSTNNYRQDSLTGKIYDVNNPMIQDSDEKFRILVKGFIDWTNARQLGVDHARKQMQGKTDVIVRHALEVNFTYIDKQDDPYPYSDSPILLKSVIPYTDCDLYSYSCWSTQTISRSPTMTERLRQVESAIGDSWVDINHANVIKQRRPLSREGQITRIMIGEYGAPERWQLTDSGGWANVITAQTDRRQREVISSLTQSILDYGAEFAIFWEIFCNVPRIDTKPPVKIDFFHGERATSNEQMQGSWLIRVDGSRTLTYDYFKNILNQDE